MPKTITVHAQRTETIVHNATYQIEVLDGVSEMEAARHSLVDKLPPDNDRYWGDRAAPRVQIGTTQPVVSAWGVNFITELRPSSIGDRAPRGLKA